MSNETRKRGGAATKNATKSNTELDTQVADFKTQWKNRAETIFRETLPKKILELDTLAESEKFAISRLSEVNVKLNIPVPDPKLFQNEHNSSKKRKVDCLNDTNDNDVQGSQVYILPSGSVSINPVIDEIITLVKPQAIELIGYANQIKMWISFLIPKIEDGNNFGVSIQEDAMSEARQIESDAASYLDQISRYYLTRGKIISKVAKYPHVDDYRRTVVEIDEKEFISLRLVLIELRNHYANLHDLLSKNIEKIKKPRSSNNTDNMY